MQFLMICKGKFSFLFVKGEFIGGCDIVKDMFEKGELKKVLEEKKLI